MSISYEGSSYWIEDKPAPRFDMFCPLCGGEGDFNYYKSECERRMKDPTHSATCYPVCKAAGLLKKGKKTQAQALTKNSGKRGRRISKEKKIEVEKLLKLGIYSMRKIA